VSAMVQLVLLGLLVTVGVWIVGRARSWYLDPPDERETLSGLLSICESGELQGDERREVMRLVQQRIQ
jgi:hypothetical protein